MVCGKKVSSTQFLKHFKPSNSTIGMKREEDRCLHSTKPPASAVPATSMKTIIDIKGIIDKSINTNKSIGKES